MSRLSHLGWLRGASLSALFVAVAASCSNPKDDEDFVPSEPGADQPKAGGAQLAEAAACDSLKAADTAARKALSCPANKAVCPAYIRPAGVGDDCFQYSKNSVDACVSAIGEYTTCEDFESHPCLVTALPKQCAGSVEPEPSEGGAGGAPSEPSTDAGAGGELSSAGAAGAP